MQAWSQAKAKFAVVRRMRHLLHGPQLSLCSLNLASLVLQSALRISLSQTCTAHQQLSLEILPMHLPLTCTAQQELSLEILPMHLPVLGALAEHWPRLGRVARHSWMHHDKEG